MPNIIIHGSPYVRGSQKSGSWQRDKDYLHRRRQQLAEHIKDGIMSKSLMNSGNEGEPEFDKRVEKYSQWVTAKDKEIREFQKINRAFKQHGEEGRPVTLDNLRPDGPKLKYE